MFGRSLPRFAEDRYDVHPALKKRWNKYYFQDGVITQTLSPFEQKVVAPLLKDLPMKFVKKFGKLAMTAGPAFVCFVGALYFGETQHKKNMYHHRV